MILSSEEDAPSAGYELRKPLVWAHLTLGEWCAPVSGEIIRGKRNERALEKTPELTME